MDLQSTTAGRWKNITSHEAFVPGVTILFSAIIGIMLYIIYKLIRKCRSHSTFDMDIPLLLRQALFKLPQLSFSFIVDKWRSAVFKGKVLPSQYNKAWWSLRRYYQGIDTIQPNNADDFDPAAKFHIIHNIPYTRYFLAGILHMQIFESLCGISNAFSSDLPLEITQVLLHQCDIYGSKEAGHHLWKMMAMGSSKPWKEAMKAVTGRTTYNTSSLLNYFKPLHQWLQEIILKENIWVGWD